MLLALVCTWRLINYKHSCRTTHVVVTNRRSKRALFLPARTERSRRPLLINHSHFLIQDSSTVRFILLLTGCPTSTLQSGGNIGPALASEPSGLTRFGPKIVNSACTLCIVRKQNCTQSIPIGAGLAHSL